MNIGETYQPSDGAQRQRYSQVDLFSSEGRIGPLRYFFYSLVLPFLVFWVFAALAGIVGQFGQFGKIFGYIILAAAIGSAFVLLFQLTVQRCHDFNVTGWLATLILIPFGNFIFWLIPGSRNINRYGEPPEPTSKWVKIGAFLLFTSLIAAFTYWFLNYSSSLDLLSALPNFEVPELNLKK